MRQKTASVKGILNRMFFCITLCLVAVVTLYTACLLLLLRRQVKEYNDNSIRSYVEELDNALGKTQSENQGMTVNNLSIKTIALKNSTSAQKIEAEYQLRELVAIQTPDYGMTMVYKPESGYVFYHYGEQVNQDELFLQQSAFMHAFTDLLKDSSQYVYNQWLFYQQNGRTLLFLVNHYNQVYLCSILDVDAYLAQHNVYSYNNYASVLIRLDGQVVYCEERLAGDPMCERLQAERNGPFGVIVSSAVSAESGMELCLVTPGTELLPGILSNLAIYGIVSVTLILILRVVMRMVDQSLLFPLQEISICSAELLGQNSESIISQKQDFEEYNRIRKALNDLVVQKRALEERFITTREQKNHALLQYYQLQTRSHFFINCLKSLYGMAERNNRTQMQAMIIAFSNHLRYVFHDNLVCVTLADELREVDDYHRIIALDFPLPFLLDKEVPKKFMNAEVPQLIIQTFLENTFKYAQRGKGILLFRVEVDSVFEDGCEYLRIHICDNGGGYPEQVLSAINAEPDRTVSEYNVGIVNLRQRILILYNGNCRVHFYNEENGAHSVICIPLTRSGGTPATQRGGEE